MVIINGKEYSGNNVTVINGVVTVDGSPVLDTGNKNVEVKIEGSVGELRADGSVTVSGTVTGNVDAGGSVNCDDVGGNVSAGGSVNCDDVGGSVNAGGSVRHG
jgi:hypothetical protein